MRKYFLFPFLPLLALAVPGAAQDTEIIGRVGVGLMQFAGKDAVATSQLNYTSYNGYTAGYTNSPYGSQLGTGISLAGRLQQVSAWGGMFAFDLGYDWLRTHTGISALNYYDGVSNTARPATGTISLASNHLAAFLGLGYRLKTAVVDIDLLAGPEVAYAFDFREKGSGTYDGSQAWNIDNDRWERQIVDPRLRGDATVWFHRFGVNASYSYGFRNYQSGVVGASPMVYSRILRLGLAYRLR
ncbi:hypothetical protein [Hymenobacter rubidus]|uniref:hypothetical protein n=1 Tax=Hymenobacter rubidus TaxID=1441626 RepID=UPI00191C9E2E|nr:hypothetical protein [Hymenobacter rubidus]